MYLRDPIVLTVSSGYSFANKEMSAEIVYTHNDTSKNRVAPLNMSDKLSKC